MSIFDKDLVEKRLPLLSVWKIWDISYSLIGIDNKFFEYIFQDISPDFIVWDYIKKEYIIKEYLNIEKLIVVRCFEYCKIKNIKNKSFKLMIARNFRKGEFVFLLRIMDIDDQSRIIRNEDVVITLRKDD